VREPLQGMGVGSAWRRGSSGPVAEARTSTWCLRVTVGILVIHGREDVNSGSPAGATAAQVSTVRPRPVTAGGHRGGTSAPATEQVAGRGLGGAGLARARRRGQPSPAKTPGVLPVQLADAGRIWGKDLLQATPVPDYGRDR